MQEQPKNTDDFDAILDRISVKDPLAELLDAPKAKTPAAPVQNVNAGGFPCEKCKGSGRVLFGYVNIREGKCHKCNGRGFFKADAPTRAKQRAQTAARKERVAQEAVNIFDQHNPGLRTFLEGAAGWSGFAGSLLQALRKYGELTEKQLQAAQSMQAKSIARDEAKQAAKAAAVLAEATAEPVLAAMAQAFLASSQHLKNPKLRLQTEDGQKVVLSRAGVKSKNPGHIFVTDGGSYGNNTYFGRITPDGKAMYRNAPQSVQALLAAFNADPKAEMLVQGQRTGRCCMCGLELTNAESIARGVGPICAAKWGFD